MLSHVTPTADDWRFARDLYRRYSAKEGSEHIASREALAYLSACLRECRPRTVLECGAGIGTITDALLSHECGVERVVATEHDDFCLAALAKNLSHHDQARVTVLAPSDLNAELGDVEMIVGDASRGRRDVFRVAKAGTIIFVEGDRVRFRDDLTQSLSDRGLSAQFDQYGAGDRASLLYRLRARLPSALRPTRRKGCWIGRVTALAESC